MAFATQAQINEAKVRLLQNVLRVREGDTWIEYGSPEALQRAINIAQAELDSQNAGEVLPATRARQIRINSGF